MPGQIRPLVTTKYLTRRLSWKCRGVCCLSTGTKQNPGGEGSSFVSSKASWAFTPVWFSLCHGAFVPDEPHLLAWFPQAWKSILCLRELKSQKGQALVHWASLPEQHWDAATSWHLWTGWGPFPTFEGQQMVGARKSKESHSFLFDWINIKYLLWGKCCTQSRGQSCE